MAGDFAKELSRLTAGNATPRPVYALISEEPLLVREAVAALRGQVLVAAPDFNADEFLGGEVKAQRIIESASTLPMMARARWVHVRDVHRLKAAEQAALLPYLEKPSASTVLCLSGEKLDLRTKLGASLKGMGAVFALAPPKTYQLAEWIRTRARALKLTLESDAAQLLADLVGVDLGGIDMALKKLALYAGQGEAITLAHVDEAVAPTRVQSVFELTDAVGRRDMAGASLVMRGALVGGESALLLITMIARQLRQLTKVKGLAAGGHTVAQALGVQPFVADKLAEQAREYDTRELCAGLAAVHAADLRLKSSGLDPALVLDRLLVDIMARPEKAS